MYPPYKRTLTPADRIIFENWLRRIATIYGALALLVISAIALGLGTGGNPRDDIAAIATSSPPPGAR